MVPQRHRQTDRQTDNITIAIAYSNSSMHERPHVSAWARGPFLPRQDGRQATERNHAHRFGDYSSNSTPVSSSSIPHCSSSHQTYRRHHRVYPLHLNQTAASCLAYSDIFYHSASRLKSSRSIWSTDTRSSTEELWR